jgi:hypothetical protein
VRISQDWSDYWSIDRDWSDWSDWSKRKDPGNDEVPPSRATNPTNPDKSSRDPWRPSRPSVRLPLSDLWVPVAGLVGFPLDCLTGIWPAEPSFTASAGRRPLPRGYHQPT